MLLKDRFDRSFHYLRLSVTDRCNFRCQYCLPHGYRKEMEEDALSGPEITRLVKAFVDLGLHKVRLTGGEPTLRPDLVEIVGRVREAGAKKIALSTNGFRLKELVPPLVQAGLQAVNVSVDSLVPERFTELTGVSRLGEVLEGIELARQRGLAVKLNAVLLKETMAEWDRFERWPQQGVSVRFIELMETHDNRPFFQAHHISATALQEHLLLQGWRRLPRPLDAGPAVEFAKEGIPGTIGLIAPYRKGFCETCNRLRVDSRGRLRLCLFGSGGYELRPYLQSSDQRAPLQQAVQALLLHKEASHHLKEGDYGATRHFAAMGG